MGVLNNTSKELLADYYAGLAAGLRIDMSTTGGQLIWTKAHESGTESWHPRSCDAQAVLLEDALQMSIERAPRTLYARMRNGDEECRAVLRSDREDIAQARRHAVVDLAARQYTKRFDTIRHSLLPHLSSFAERAGLAVTTGRYTSSPPAEQLKAFALLSFTRGVEHAIATVRHNRHIPVVDVLQEVLVACAREWKAQTAEAAPPSDPVCEPEGGSNG